MSEKNRPLRKFVLSIEPTEKSAVDSSELPVVTVFRDDENYYLASGMEHLEKVLLNSCRHLGTGSVELAVEVRKGTEIEAMFYGCCSEGRRRRGRKSDRSTKN